MDCGVQIAECGMEAAFWMRVDSRNSRAQISGVLRLARSASGNATQAAFFLESPSFPSRPSVQIVLNRIRGIGFQPVICRQGFDAPISYPTVNRIYSLLSTLNSLAAGAARTHTERPFKDCKDCALSRTAIFKSPFKNPAFWRRLQRLQRLR